MTAQCLLLFGTAIILSGKDVELTEAGRVSIDFVNMEAGYRNTVFLVQATYPGGRTVRLASSGCTAETPRNGQGIALVTDKYSAFGCRVTLDSNPATTNQIEAFPAGTSFELGLCVDKAHGGVCDDFWSSNPNKNSDHADHLLQKPIRPERYRGTLLQLGWEDSRDNGDKDFNDAILYLRVERDSDGDGLWDDWETFGVDTNGDGEIDLDLPALGAKPGRKDLFLEIDYMGKAPDGHDHKPNPEAIRKVVEAFANAPVPNPDGSTGITLHVDVSNEIPHQELMIFGRGFAAVKADPAHFGDKNPRRFVYRYAIFGHGYDSAVRGSGGVAEKPGDDLMVTLIRPSAQAEAGTLMHELGHSLGLDHGGGDDVNDKPNYRSVMNYRHQFTGIPYWEKVSTVGASGEDVRIDPGQDEYSYRIDYSRLVLPELNEANLDERTPVFPVNSPPARTRFRAGNIVKERVEIPVIAFNCGVEVRPELVIDGEDRDWNCNGNRGDRSVKADLNNDSVEQTLVGHDDWNNLIYPFQNDSLRFGAVYREPNLIELSPQQAAEGEKNIVYRPIAIIQPTPVPVLNRQTELDGLPSFVPKGGKIVSYQWRVVGLPAALTNERGPRVVVQFGGGPGEYRLELTVTAQNGLAQTATTTVVYAGR